MAVTRSWLRVSHTELLRLYAEAQMRVVSEWSGSIEADARELRSWCEKYANDHLVQPPSSDFWATYITGGEDD